MLSGPRPCLSFLQGSNEILDLKRIPSQAMQTLVLVKQRAASAQALGYPGSTWREKSTSPSPNSAGREVVFGRGAAGWEQTTRGSEIHHGLQALSARPPSHLLSWDVSANGRASAFPLFPSPPALGRTTSRLLGSETAAANLTRSWSIASE